MDCEWMSRSLAGAQCPVRGRQLGTGGGKEGVRFEQRAMSPLSRVETGVQSACSSIGAIRLRSALGLRAAASVVRARDNAVLLASALHAMFEQQSDPCASLARVRAIPLLPSIPCPLRQSLQATVAGSFRPLFRGPGQNDVAETTQSSA